MFVLDESAAEFVTESREGLDQLDRDLVELESRPADVELLKRIFRVMHSLKGSAGFLGLAYLEELTHAGENLLSLIYFDADRASAIEKLYDAALPGGFVGVGSTELLPGKPVSPGWYPARVSVTNALAGRAQ